MITKERILSIFHKMLDEHWDYRWGAAEEGCVDCSGAFVYAYRQEGLSVYHGSNRMAREETPELLAVSQAKPGMIAYKKRLPGEAGYDLPDEYLVGGSRYNGDLADYHHVGLVDEDPAYVLNAKSTKDGFVRSKITEGWDAVGHGKQIDYEGTAQEGTEAVPAPSAPGTTTPVWIGEVTASNREPVKMRAEPSIRCNLYWDIPCGTLVEVLDYGPDWSKIRINKQEGYMMSKFISNDLMNGKEDAPDNEPEIDDNLPVMQGVATVYAENGKPVKMRAKPTTSAALYWNVPSGEQVEVLDEDTHPGWWKIKYDGREGWMMDKFLSRG